jgi:hypothetical protein
MDISLGDLNGVRYFLVSLADPHAGGTTTAAVIDGRGDPDA